MQIFWTPLPPLSHVRAKSWVLDLLSCRPSYWGKEIPINELPDVALELSSLCSD